MKEKEKSQNVYLLLAYCLAILIPVVAFYTVGNENKINDDGDLNENKMSSVKSSKSTLRKSDFDTKRDHRYLDDQELYILQLMVSGASYESILEEMLAWLEENEADALANLQRLRHYLVERGFDGIDFVNHIADHLFDKHGPEGVVEILASYDPDRESLIRLIYERLVENWVVGDQESFKKWWFDSPMLGNIHTVERLVNAQLENLDLIEAIQFNESMPDDDLRKQVILAEAYKGLVDTDRNTAKEYLAQIEPTAYANTAYWKIAVNLADEQGASIDDVIFWSDRIQQNNEERESVLVSSLARFAELKPGEYKDWLETTSFFENNLHSKESIKESVDRLVEIELASKENQLAQTDNPESPYYVPTTE